MTFAVSDLRAALASGVARPNKYQVTFHAPFGSVWDRELSVLCADAELPGRHINTTAQMIYGVQRKMPYGVLYDDLTLSFICSNWMVERKYFDAWQSFITNPTNNYFNYYDKYKSDILIVHLDDVGTGHYGVLVEEAYPLTIQSQPLSYADNNNNLRLTVTFAYRRWRNASDIAQSKFVTNGIPETVRGGNGPGPQLPEAPQNPENMGGLGSPEQPVFSPGNIPTGLKDKVENSLTGVGDFLGDIGSVLGIRN